VDGVATTMGFCLRNTEIADSTLEINLLMVNLTLQLSALSGTLKLSPMKLNH